MSGDGNIYPHYRQAPAFALGATVAAYATYTTLYDSGDPTATSGSGMLPAIRAYLHARMTTASATTRTTLVEIRHFVNTTLIGIEEFGLLNPRDADADGSDLRAVLCGYAIQPRGNRVVIAASSVSEAPIDWVLRWGEYETPRITEVGGRFAYNATGGNIAAGTIFGRFGILRPMKSLVVTASVVVTSGTAINLAFQPVNAHRNASAGLWGTIAGAVLTTAVQRFPIAGLGADTGLDQNVGLDGCELFNNAQLNQAAPDVGVVLWRATTVHI